MYWFFSNFQIIKSFPCPRKYFIFSKNNWYCYIVIYMFMQHHNDTTTNIEAWRITQEGRTQEWLRCRKDGRMKTSLEKYSPLSLFVRFAFERMLETEHKHILTPLLWPSRCVLFSWCWGPLHRGFPRTPSVGCGLPYHIWSLLSGSLPATALAPQTQLR